MNTTETQITTINHVGILSPMDANGEKDVWDAFKHGLAELGYSEGKGVTFISRFAENLRSIARVCRRSRAARRRRNRGGHSTGDQGSQISDEHYSRCLPGGIRSSRVGLGIELRSARGQRHRRRHDVMEAQPSAVARAHGEQEWPVLDAWHRCDDLPQCRRHRHQMFTRLALPALHPRRRDGDDVAMNFRPRNLRGLVQPQSGEQERAVDRTCRVAHARPVARQNAPRSSASWINASHCSKSRFLAGLLLII